MTELRKLSAQPQTAFVLHTYPYRETSLIVELLSRESGRLAVVARGAKRPRSILRGMLLPFQPLALSWFGKSELRTLKSAEWQGGQPLLSGAALICGFYLNELLLRLTARDDPHVALFDRYSQSLQALATTADYAPVLRRFEKGLLEALGYALPLSRDINTGDVIQTNKQYYYIVERGPTFAAGRNTIAVTGKTLLDLAADCYDDPTSLRESKLLLRTVINHYLGDAPIYTRQILRDLHQL